MYVYGCTYPRVIILNEKEGMILKDSKETFMEGFEEEREEEKDVIIKL